MKHSFIRPLRVLISFFILLELGISAAVQAGMTENGIASYSKLGREYYLVALYSDGTLDTVEAAFDAAKHRKIVVKITARSWKPNQFSTTWLDDISINNNLSRSSPEITQLLEFIRFPRESLATGDTIEIEYTPGQNSIFQFNGETVLVATGPVLFDYVLNSWLGPRPPSRFFSRDLLRGKADSTAEAEALFSRLNSIEPSSDRTFMISKWKEQDLQAEKRKEQERLSYEAEQQKLAEAIAEEEQTRLRLKQERDNKEAAMREALRISIEAKKAAELARENAQKNDFRKDAARAEEIALIQSQRAKEAEAVALKKMEELQKAKELEQQAKEQRMSELLQRYNQSIYHWKLENSILSKVKYPAWSRQFGEEGLVEIDLKVSEDGSPFDMEVVSRNHKSLLASETLEAISKAAPLPVPPDNGPQNRRYRIRYNFSLTQEFTQYRVKPRMSAELYQYEYGTLSDEHLLKIKTAYTNKMAEIIQNNITYPYWAKSMNQKGEVSAQVTLNYSGMVENAEIIQASRHKLLNEEILAAVERSAPLPPIPDEITAEHLTIQIIHQFSH